MLSRRSLLLGGTAAGAVQECAEELPAGAEVAFAPGGHDEGYWRRVLPEQLALLGAAVRSRA